MREIYKRQGETFSAWIEALREDVVEGEYGYEPGEFAVTPENWRPLYNEGLTPSQAFLRALDAHGEARKTDEAERRKNWEHIQAEDAAAIAAYHAPD